MLIWELEIFLEWERTKQEGIKMEINTLTFGRKGLVARGRGLFSMCSATEINRTNCLFLNKQEASSKVTQLL